MKTGKKLQVLFLFLGVMAYSCQKEEQVKIEPTAKTIQEKSVKEPDRLLYSNVVADFIHSGATEISLEKSGIDLKSIPYENFSACKLFQAETGLFIVLGYKPDSEDYEKAQANCDQKYQNEAGDGMIDCEGTGTTCRWEKVYDDKGKEIGCKIVICEEK